MDDPLFTSVNTVGTKNMSSKFLAIPKKIHSNQSFILEQQFQESVGVPFDISSATTTLYVAGFNNTLDRVALASGVLSDSGSGTIDTVTFTVPKDLIPTSLGSLPQRNPGNSVFFYILEDTDSVLEFAQEVNVIDPSYNLQGTTDPSAATITTQRNDLGNVEDTTVVTPPGTQTLGLAYVVGPAGATGDWAGQENNLATSNGSNWIFTLPEEGNFVFDLNLGAQKLFDGSLWNISSSGDMLASTYDPQAIEDDAFDRANMTGTQTSSTISNFDTSVNTNAAVVLNTAKVTNATHTGEVTGSGALIVDSTVVTNKTTEVPVSGDFLLFSDTSDSGALKKADASILTPSIALDELTDVILTAEAQGALLYRNATGWVNLPAGTNGQFLKTQGSSANPAWEAIPGGGDMLESTYDPASVSEQLVGLTATQSLTNKTINGVVLTSAGSASEVLNAAGNYIPVSGSGDVTGPASAVDENITVFDLTTGKAIKDSGVNISAVTANTAKISYTDAAAVALNTAKVTNATHTGDVTGSTALTIAAGAIDIAMHSATGTAGSNTFYRGDNTWSTVTGGILPTGAASTKTGDYTILVGDITAGVPLTLGSATTADRTFTLDVSLFTNNTEKLNIINKSDYRLELIVSNTGTMSINDLVTNKYIWKGEGILTIIGDTATNADIIAGG